MRLPIRSLLLLSVAALSGCADFGPSAAAGRQRASLAVAPRFEDGAARTSAVLAQVGIGFDNVRIIIVHPAADTVADTTIVYSPSDTARALTLKVLAVPNDLLTVTMQFRAAASVLFEGTANATAVPLTSTVTPEKAIDVVVKYVGPGATAAKLSITPGSGNYLSGITTQFTAVAADAQGVPIPNAPIAWSVSNDAVATISTTGLLTPKVVRGSVTVKATIGTVAQSVSVNLQPAAAGIRVVQGAAQTAPPGSTLPLPVIIELDGTDGQPITGSGLSATFVANTAGSIAPASVPLDANGRAQAAITLGTNAGGIFLYTATVGAFSVIIPEIAVVGPPTQLIPNGPTNFSMVVGKVPNPVPAFRVADAQGNSVPGVILQATLTGNGKTQTATFPADTIGLVDVGALAAKQLPVAGTYTVTIASGNPAVSFPSLTYTITVTASSPSPSPEPSIDTSVEIGEQSAVALVPITVDVALFDRRAYRAFRLGNMPAIPEATAIH